MGHAAMDDAASNECKLWQQEPHLWACLLMMKYTKNLARFNASREAIKKALTTAELNRMRAAYKEIEQWQTPPKS